MSDKSAKKAKKEFQDIKKEAHEAAKKQRAPEKEFNYEVIIGGQEINIVANTMTEHQARTILEHFVKQAGLKEQNDKKRL